MANDVTIKDVAREAGVSIGTVSHVLHNHLSVTTETRQKVMTVVARLGYQNQRPSKKPPEPPKSIKDIGFLFYSPVGVGSFHTNVFWSYVLTGAIKEASRTNIRVTYLSAPEILQQPKPVAALSSLGLDGIILAGPSHASVISKIKEVGSPIVLLDNYEAQSQLDVVMGNSFEGAKLATNYLIAKGHTSIAFIDGPLVNNNQYHGTYYSFDQRLFGYQAALFQAGLQFNPALVERSEMSSEDGYQVCQVLLNRGEPFTAIVCVNDESSIGAIRALHDANYAVPDDMSIISFDDIESARYITPPLTTMRIGKELLGAMAVRRLAARCADLAAPVTTTLLEYELIERASVAAPQNTRPA